MIGSPLDMQPAFQFAGIPVSMTVVVTWAIMLAVITVVFLLTRKLEKKAKAPQAVLELLCGTIDAQIEGTLQRDPAPYRTLIGTLFVFILAANWSSMVPGIEPPTAHLETDAALALVVLIATVYYGVKANGLLGYLKTFAEPSWVMIPLNMVEQITRTFSLMVRLFGNIMSGVFIIAIILSLAGLLVPIPLMALDLLTGAVQAYIFVVLAAVSISAAVGNHSNISPKSTKQEETK